MENTESRYEAVRTEKDIDDASSITEVNQSVSEDEEAWSSAHPSQRWRKHNLRATLVSRLQGHLNTVLLLVIAGLLVYVVIREDRSPVSNALRNELQVGSDYRGTGPRIPTRVMKWDADETFVPEDPIETFSNQTLATWQTLMPKGAGWPGTVEYSTTTMTHSLHCLFMMSRIYSATIMNKTEFLPNDYHTHYLHCIDYLRQGVMCSADLAVEPHSRDDAGNNGPTDGGWNGLHVCKDYGQVIQYLETDIAQGQRVVLPIDD